MSVREAGRKGGKALVPKGLATMDPDEAARIRSLGGKARWKGHPPKPKRSRAPARQLS